MIEQWRDIRGVPGFKVSNHGRVKNPSGKLVSSYKDGPLNGHSISLNGNRFRVNRLVGMAWCADYSHSLYADYVDGNRDNCRADNLRWVPRSKITTTPYSRNFEMVPKGTVSKLKEEIKTLKQQLKVLA